MATLTDEQILRALELGKTIGKNGKIFLRELEYATQSVIYSKNISDFYWKPFSPTVEQLKSNDWIVLEE